MNHHRADVNLTARGRDQAAAAGRTLAGRVAAGDRILIFHSPLARNLETAELLNASLTEALRADGRAGNVVLQSAGVDETLSNVRFIFGSAREMEEPSVLFPRFDDPAFVNSLSPAQIAFYRGFYASRDPMGYWMTHDSRGWAETTGAVWARFRGRLREVLNDGRAAPARGQTHWIGVTHSGAMRVVLREAFGTDPGEPEFCEIIVVEPTGQPGVATVSYRGRSAALALKGEITNGTNTRMARMK